jgi:hypothetical protein
LWNDGELDDGLDENGQPRPPREMHPDSQHSPVKSMKKGDFTPEQVAEFERLYGKGIKAA